jgi:D-amino peptidase
MRHLALVCALTAAAGIAAAGQTGKKVFISVDMEGISGISGADQLSAEGREYDRSRKLMAEDVNAAIRGARAGARRRSSSTTRMAVCET